MSKKRRDDDNTAGDAKGADATDTNVYRLVPRTPRHGTPIGADPIGMGTSGRARLPGPTDDNDPGPSAA